MYYAFVYFRMIKQNMVRQEVHYGVQNVGLSGH